ncbi:Dor1-like family-domain-containing protein [Lentinula raphanica]|nr:Dor1-like family-domain-containing protein [Lentinula raphanica]
MSETLPELLNVQNTNYLEHLTSLDLETLLSEPKVLQTQSHHLTSSLTSLTHASYPTFVSLYSSISDFTSSLSQISSALDSLLHESLPALESSVSSWNTETSSVLTTRRKTLNVLESHDKLRDLLDIPLLINTCARNAYFSEALSLASHARRLAGIYPSPPFILKSVFAEVDVAMNQMLISLLTMLHEPNRKLPALWKAVNFLRKMEGAFGGEDEIALAFLSGREQCLKASLENQRRDIFRIAALEEALSTRDKEDLAKYLGKYIGSWRESVYDLITQYDSIFLAGTQEENASSMQLRALLMAYISHVFKIHLMPLLAPSQHSREPPIALLPITSLPSLVTQLTYCAAALGRVGADFRFSVARCVSDAVVRIFSGEILNAEKRFLAQFERNLPTSKDKEVSNPHTSARRANLRSSSRWLVKQEIQDPNFNVLLVNSKTISHTPPSLLTSYPPLAVHGNEVIEILNALRACAPLSVAKGYECLGDVEKENKTDTKADLVSSSNGAGLIQKLESSLVREGRTLFDYVKAVVQVEEMSSQEALNSLAFARAFFEAWVPWVMHALVVGVFGLQEEFRSEEDGLGIHGKKADSELGNLRARWRSWAQDKFNS